MNVYEEAISIMCDADSHSIIMDVAGDIPSLNYRLWTVEVALEFYRLSQLDNKEG